MADWLQRINCGGQTQTRFETQVGGELGHSHQKTRNHRRCHRHEGTDYITRPWARDEDDIQTIKGQYRHAPRGECQQSEEQPQTSISHHSPRGECQYSNIKCRQETASLTHG